MLSRRGDIAPLQFDSSAHVAVRATVEPATAAPGDTVLVKRHLSRRAHDSYVNWTHLNRLAERHLLANPRRLTDLIALSGAVKSAV